MQPIDKAIKFIIQQYVYYQVERGGMLYRAPQGIPRASALSPYIAAMQFYHLDELLFGCSGVVYQRYMDDFLLLSVSRHRLRRAIALLKQGIVAQGLHLHPDKTVIGKVEKGFDWLGAHYDGEKWSGPSARSMSRTQEKIKRLTSTEHKIRHARYYDVWKNSINKYNVVG